ncbi:uncharacterized protein LOC143577736 [Bidens hawaiensis]|uniref:uncharacterized protein LOC143577736 n=1 Tax=Bidens hawaiensis TaxID=980011 RepID=UPI004049FC1C
MISGNTKKVWEPRSNLDSADVTNTSADVIKPVKLVNSPNGPDLDATSVKDDNLEESKSNVHIEPEPEPESGTTDLSTSTDSCSSSLSEGDGNTSFSSNPQNAESSSTSDSEYANHLAEMVKENASELLSETAESVTGNNNSNIIPPPLQAQSIHFPVFQPPSMGYYHQGPVPWTTGPPNGLVPLGPLPHPNHYMFASPGPFGYGNSRYVQYGVGGLHPPPLNHGQLPMYQAVPPVNMTIPFKGGHVNSEKAQNGHNENENSDKTQKGNAGFSLFHFGGPVDVSNGFNPTARCVKEEVDVNVDSCGVVKDVEEYNLFAASNGIKFSIF